ncbi:MAG: aminotransferase class V-fold PLP-dependent enzyme [Bacteroidia bacterium]|nr:aminotransferase class V-fold PLP-dependent enzyme [Bacteroidia bacterium]
MHFYNTYFDNAATSFPKPPEVAAGIAKYLNETGGPYGRSFYNRAVEVSHIVEETRELLANIIGTKHISNLVFTHNATHAINIVLKGMTFSELARLVNDRHLKIIYLPAYPDGTVNIERIPEFLSKHTKLVVVNHISNVNGVIQPIRDIKHVLGSIPMLVDAAQSVGDKTIDADKNDFDYIAVTCHKYLLGPTGIGGLFIKNPELIFPLIEGGTGSNSGKDEQPDFMPDKFDGGTPNIAGIFGLKEAIMHKPETMYSESDFYYLLESIKKTGKYKLFSSMNKNNRSFLFSLNHTKMDCSALGLKIYEKYGIETRVGLHCAPFAHKYLGTFPNGTLRISPSVYHKPEDFEYLINALRNID